jgi:hypothetical protein
MDESKRSAIGFLEKEIKTYKALSLFLSKKDLKDDVSRRREESHDQCGVLQRPDEGSETNCL